MKVPILVLGLTCVETLKLEPSRPKEERQRLADSYGRSYDSSGSDAYVSNTLTSAERSRTYFFVLTKFQF